MDGPSCVDVDAVTVVVVICGPRHTVVHSDKVSDPYICHNMRLGSQLVSM